MQPDQPEEVYTWVRTLGVDTQVLLMTEETLHAIGGEMRYQEIRWGIGKEQSLPGYLLAIEKQLEDAKRGWTNSLDDRKSSLHNLVQVAALALRALNQYGVTGNPVATNDKREDRP